MECRLYFLIFLYVSICTFSCVDSRVSLDASIKYRVSGVVSDEIGNPLDSVNITLFDFAETYYTSSSFTKCTQTDFDGRFDFVVSDGNGVGSVLMINPSIERFDSNWCGGDFLEGFDTKKIFYSDDSYNEFELDFDVILHPSIRVSITNSIMNGVRYRIFHNGVSTLDSVDQFYWNELYGLDTAIHYIRPSQNLEITYSSLYNSESKDTIIELGSEPLFIELDSI